MYSVSECEKKIKQFKPYVEEWPDASYKNALAMWETRLKETQEAEAAATAPSKRKARKPAPVPVTSSD